MKKWMLILLTTLCMAAGLYALNEAERKLVIAITESDWQAIPANVKQQGNAILKQCTNAKKVMDMTPRARHKVQTNTLVIVSVFGKNAQALRSTMPDTWDATKMQQLKNAWTGYGGVIEWVSNVDIWLESRDLEWIPSEDED